jgi:hypothetical protein
MIIFVSLTNLYGQVNKRLATFFVTVFLLLSFKLDLKYYTGLQFQPSRYMKQDLLTWRIWVGVLYMPTPKYLPIDVTLK